MLLKVFSLFDIKSDSFHTPFFFASPGQAVRAFKDLVADKSTVCGRHPADYKLVQIGEFVDESGLLKALPHVSLGFGTDYVEKAEVVVPLPPKKVG